MDTIEVATSLLDEAIYEPGRLPETLTSVGIAAGLGHLALFKLDPEDPKYVASGEVAQIYSDFVSGGWREVDVRTTYCARSKIGEIVRDHLVVPEGVRRASPLYNEFYRGRDIGWMAGWQVMLGHEHWGFSVVRSRGGFYTDEDVHKIARLASPVNRAMTFALAMRHVRVAGMLDGLAAANIAAVLLASNGGVLSATPAAEKMFDQEFGIAGGRLTARDPSGAASLARLAWQARSELTSTELQTIAINRQDGRKPVLVSPVAVRGVGLDVLPGSRILLMLIDLDAKNKDAQLLLKRLFALTSAEAAVAQLLAEGRSVASIAEQRSVTQDTVRTQIKIVLQKLDSSRQSDVVRLVERVSRGGER